MAKVTDSKAMTQIGWDDAPHLSEQAKKELLASTPPYLRDARSKGIPSLGSGAIYPIPESEIVVDPFEIPTHWKKAAAMDVGWNRTAAVWGAVNRDDGTCYIYSEYYKGAAEPAIHVQGIKARGDWIPIAIDPAARGRGQSDGSQLFDMYRQLGLRLSPADNAIEAGLYMVWEMLSSGKLKIFSTLRNILSEYRLYRRDEKGRIVKADDHLMDAMRYWCMTGQNLATFKPVQRKSVVRASGNRITGY